MGASIVKDIDNISFVLPPRHKLHLGLYINTAATMESAVTNSLLNRRLASMQLCCHDNRADSEEKKPPTISRVITDGTTSNEGVENTVNCGVPGFPDFPDCWDGGTPSTPKASNRHLHKKQSNRFFSSSKGSKQKQFHRRIHRTAVNIPYGSPTSRAVVSLSPGRDMKRCARDERKLRRLAKVVQLKERRRTKKDMGDICRGMAAIKW